MPRRKVRRAFRRVALSVHGGPATSIGPAWDVPADGLGDADHLRIQARAEAVVARRWRGRSKHKHLDPEMRDRLVRLHCKVPAVTVESEHTADEIAAALHAEMPWMAPATEAALMALRRDARSGTPVRIGPVILVDQLCKAGRLRSTGGISATFQPALLGLLEPESPGAGTARSSGSPSTWVT